MFNHFDIHSHLNFEDFDADREDVLREMKERRIGTITVGTGIKTSKESVALAGQEENIYATVGIHPNDGSEDNPEELEKLITHPKVVAVGECGLDYFRESDIEAAKKRQIPVFEKQIELALKYGKPLMIHARSSYNDVADILESYHGRQGEKLRGNMHFFAGNVDEARRFLDIGFTLSFTGVLTFTSDYDEVVRFAPLDMIMSETDAPYAAPVPFRGKRNSPLYVEEVVKALARIREIPQEEVRTAILANVSRVFGIPTA